MNKKQVLVYGVLEPTNDLRSVFVGYIRFKKLTKFRKFVETFFLLHDQAQEQEIRFILIIWDNEILKNPLNSTVSVK